RAHGQKDPLVEYKKESWQMLQALTDRIDEEVLRWIYLYQPVVGPAGEGAPGDGGGEGGDAPVRPRPRGPRPPIAGAAVREPREPGLALAGARSAPRNLSFNNPSEAPTAFAKAERPEAHGGGDDVQTYRREGKKVGRNDPCPCGSGKKYKKCHGANG